MEGDANQMSQSPSLCRSGCGFYGNPSTDGMCSKCFKDAVKRKQSNPTTTPSLAGRNSPTVAASIVAASAAAASSEDKIIPSKDLSTASPTVPILSVTSPSQDREKQDLSNAAESNEPHSSSASTSVTPNAETDSSLSGSVQKEPKKKNRCHVCRKRVGLTGFSCRCSGLFCSLHRYSNEHDCPFDYKELGAKEIRKNNPLVVGEKVQKI